MDHAVGPAPDRGVPRKAIRFQPKQQDIAGADVGDRFLDQIVTKSHHHQVRAGGFSPIRLVRRQRTGQRPDLIAIDPANQTQAITPNALQAGAVAVWSSDP